MHIESNIEQDVFIKHSGSQWGHLGSYGWGQGHKVVKGDASWKC